MAVLKDKGSMYKGKTWRVVCYYKDWRGERIRHEKRGFATRHDALEYERTLSLQSRLKISICHSIRLLIFI